MSQRRDEPSGGRRRVLQGRMDEIDVLNERRSTNNTSRQVQRRNDHAENSTNQRILPEIDSLVKRKDVFSLICMLRVQDEKRLDSVVSLMRFAREAERTRTRKSEMLRAEICSSGGVHSLLDLLQQAKDSRELRVTAALAVAYLLPTFVSGPLPSTLQLEIIECLQFLFDESPNAIVIKGEVISRLEMSQASGTGAAIISTMQKNMITSGESTSEALLGEVILRNESLLESIKIAEKQMKDKATSARQESPDLSQPPFVTSEIEQMVNRRDMFGLICMLRAQNEKRLDSAYALMRFARNAERTESIEACRLRDEICSLGGMHSLLALFQCVGATRELAVVVALAVAYLLPSFLKSNTPPASTIGRKIIECLRFLFTTDMPVASRGEVLGRTEMFRAAFMGVHTFWFCALSPSSQRRKDAPLLPSERPFSRARRGLLQLESTMTYSWEVCEMQEVLEMFVSLITQMAKSGAELTPFFFPMVENMCAYDVSRSIIVRQGLLHILLMWVRSLDMKKIWCAAVSVNQLAKTQDSYMAGWIHSQIIVNDETLPAIVKLLASDGVRQDARLAMAEILRNLCVALHTQAAVVESNCIPCLINLLFEFGNTTTQKVACVAGNALLQLLVGAMNRLSAFNSGELDDSLSPTTMWKDKVISDIVEGGAISQFVAIAHFSTRGKLRAMCVEALRVLSEEGRTRLRLLEDGAAGALGHVLKDDGDILTQAMSCHDEQLSPKNEVVKEVHQALCTWANIVAMNEKASDAFVLAEATIETTEKGCSQFIDTGGLESLLFVGALPFSQEGVNVSNSIQMLDLVVEACRPLASMSQLLLSSSAASRGYAAWSPVVLQILTRVLSIIADMDHINDLVWELKFDVFRGIGALANYEPLKLVIVDKCLPTLFHAKTARGGNEPRFVSAAADQVCTAMGFTQDNLVNQIDGNDPKLVGDWFCLQRSLIIQSMVRLEIHKILAAVWNTPFQDILSAGLLTADLGRGEIQTLDDIFKHLAFEAESIATHSNMLQQYHDIYEKNVTNGEGMGPLDFLQSWKPSESCAEHSLMSSHVYPLNSTSTEKEWVLAHRRFMQSMAFKPSANDTQNGLMSNRVQKLLDSCIPSRLIQQDLLPIHDFRPESSFDFHSLLMPQRRYFSFRREGQLVFQLYETNASSAKLNDTYWTLGFTNSSFAGEFSETLTQALYRCPLIRGISFTRDDDWQSVWKSESEDEGQDNTGLLGHLAGSLPPWLSSLTYDNTLSDFALLELVTTMKSMAQAPASPIGSCEEEREERSRVELKQRTFHSFAIRNSPNLASETWQKLFELLRGLPKRSLSLKSYPLESLKVLDLSGNSLGDFLCSIVLERALGKDPGCSLEKLDLSRNAICRGLCTSKVFRSYGNRHRHNTIYGMTSKWSRRSSLAYLNLGSNELNTGGLALEVIALLKHDDLRLESLDLSDNGLECHGYQFTSVLLDSLVQNAYLKHLNLSKNEFSSPCIDRLLDGLNHSDSGLGMAFLRLENNTPPLSESQQKSLNLLANISRASVLRRFFDEMEQTKVDFATPQIDPQDGEISDEQTLSSSSSEEGFGGFDGLMGKHSITVLFSAPLVYQDIQGNLLPSPKLDFDREKNLLLQCFKEIRRDIKLLFDNATRDRLLKVKARQCACLHYSGHGHPTHLPFEDGRGGPDYLGAQDLRYLIERTGGEPFKFVFVSACHSGLSGETFVNAGVPHVVCCEQESEVKDSAALNFTQHFYFSLALGHTIKESFEQGRKAVRDVDERKKFVLLPKGDEHKHDTRIFFDAKTVRKWPLTRPISRSQPLPAPPQHFLGREVDMYHALDLVLKYRLVSILGNNGIGRSSLVHGVCQYINERRRSIVEIDRILYVRISQNSRFAVVLHELLGIAVGKTGDGIPWELVRKAIWTTFYNSKSLLVINHTELLEETDDLKDLIMFLSFLFEEETTRVLLTGRRKLGLASIAGVTERSYELKPLNFCNTVHLFCCLCNRRQLFKRLEMDKHPQADLLPTDKSITEHTRYLFEALGNGVPLEIENTAYSITPEELSRLGLDGS